MSSSASDDDIPVDSKSDSLAGDLAFDTGASLAVLPLDLVRVRLQTQGPIKTYSSITGVTQPLDMIQARMQYQRAEVGPVFNSSFECAKAVLRENGPMGLFRGLVPRLVYTSMITLAVTLPALAYRQAHPEIEAFDDAPTLHQGAVLLAPASIAFVIGHPFDMIATRLQAMPPPPSSDGRIIFRSMRDEARLVIAQHGVRGLYAGMKASLLCMGASMAIAMPMMAALDPDMSFQDWITLAKLLLTSRDDAPDDDE
ncbi:hypothetical protein ATCC90586_006217 [Pythium insidiosum]|nr:hypothetical protein ATCC90586_006217 [Pythium insidiosum]